MRFNVFVGRGRTPCDRYLSVHLFRQSVDLLIVSVRRFTGWLIGKTRQSRIVKDLQEDSELDHRLGWLVGGRDGDLLDIMPFLTLRRSITIPHQYPSTLFIIEGGEGTYMKL